jgi:hypothetical protein
MSHDLTKAIQDAAKKNKDLIKAATDIPSTITGTIPRVFLFKTDLPFDDAEKIGEWIYKSIKRSVLVIPECVEFIGVEDLFKTERME